MKRYIVICIIHGEEMRLHFDSKKNMLGYLNTVDGIEVLKIEVWKFKGIINKGAIKKWKM